MRIGSSGYLASLDLRVTPVKRNKQESDSSEEEKKQSSASGSESNEEDPAVKTQIAKLQAVDTQVKTHEAAHQGAGGGLAGGASFTYTKGPDGKQYAVAGEVPIDMSEEDTPEATIAKMEQVKAAALAPADPSPQDLKVASTAAVTAMKARLELLKEKSGNDESLDGSSNTNDKTSETKDTKTTNA